MGARAPVVVVGAGLAGLCTALACAPRRVLLVSASEGEDGSASALAQGGIAAALGPGDSVDAHVRDTLDAGAGLNDPVRVAQLARAAPWAIGWLAAQGVAFDRDDGGLRLGREGGHRADRIVHAGGDATGARIMQALQRHAATQAHIERRDGLRADALLVRGGRVAGVRLVDAAGHAELVETGAVVLATGGLGGLYARTTNPAGQRGGGLALAIAAGARLRDMEYVQFHPTALAVGGERLPLVTEALRGAGAVLRDARGRPAMLGVHPQRDLAPRDVVARRLWQLHDDGGALLDATGLPPGWSARFPTVAAACRLHGIDPATTPIPVTPAAHFHMGGIAVDGFGASSLPGLHAVGEAACSGVHGANRLASNSLLECVVMGHRLGSTLAHAPTAMPGVGPSRLREAGEALSGARLSTLRGLMWDHAGPLRSPPGLDYALDAIAALGGHFAEVRVASALLAAARANRRSAGAHWLAGKACGATRAADAMQPA